MKQCNFCYRALKKPDNPKTHNYKYCSTACRDKVAFIKNKESYIKRGGAEAQRDYIYKRKADLNMDSKMQCLICNKWYVQVGTHIVQIHKLTAREYRETMELEVKRGLTTGDYRALKANQVMTNGTVANLKLGAQYRFKKGEKVPVYVRSQQTRDKLAIARSKVGKWARIETE